MARDWETQLREWGRPPGATEQAKMENTESQIREAIRVSTALQAHTIQVAAQGSYRNLTHVPRESDVDIRVVCRDVLFPDFYFVDPASWTDAALRETLCQRFGLSDATYTFDAFRDDVGAALVARFGPPPSVTPGDKAFGVREHRYFVDSDVVATFIHRRYQPDGSWAEGVEFYSRKGARIINWPEQQQANGVEKNQATHEQFKAMVRALKNLRNEMDDQKIAAAGPIPSFLIECLVWNVPNDRFGDQTYSDDMREVLRYLYLQTETDATCSEWGEESDLKYLFRDFQRWTRAQANAFVLAAWRHVGFEN